MSLSDTAGPESTEPSQIPSSTPLPDPAAAGWLSRLVGRPSHLAMGVRLPDGKKAFYPTEIKGEEDCRSLIAAHLAGDLPPRICLRQGEGFLVEEPFALGHYTTRRDDSGSPAPVVTNAITWDIDGPGHAEGLTAEQVDQQTWAIADIAEEAGLAPTVVRSNSGAGRHVIITLPTAIDAGMAVFIAKGVLALVPGAERTEFFPRTAQLRDGQFGRLVALPLSGAAPGPGGGRIIDRHGRELTAASVRIPAPEAIAAFTDAYQRQQAAEAAIRAAQKAEGVMIAHLAHAKGGDANSTRASLEQVVRAFAEVADDRETEDDIIGIRCPTHGGTCLHVNPDQNWFFCHKCGHKGGGPGAAYMLLRLLRPAWTHAQLRTELSALANAATTTPGGVS